LCEAGPTKKYLSVKKEYASIAIMLFRIAIFFYQVYNQELKFFFLKKIDTLNIVL
jgi:hypothetical protein